MVEVYFRRGRDGTILARMPDGKIAFPDRTWSRTHPLPQHGERWEVEVTGTAKSGKCVFLKPLRTPAELEAEEQQRREEEERRRRAREEELERQHQEWLRERARIRAMLPAEQVVAALLSGHRPQIVPERPIESEDDLYTVPVVFRVGDASAVFEAKTYSGGWNEMLGDGYVKLSPEWEQVWPELWADYERLRSAMDEQKKDKSLFRSFIWHGNLLVARIISTYRECQHMTTVGLAWVRLKSGVPCCIPHTTTRRDLMKLVRIAMREQREREEEERREQARRERLSMAGHLCTCIANRLGGWPVLGPDNTGRSTHLEGRLILETVRWFDDGFEHIPLYGDDEWGPPAKASYITRYTGWHGWRTSHCVIFDGEDISEDPDKLQKVLDMLRELQG